MPIVRSSNFNPLLQAILGFQGGRLEQRQQNKAAEAGMQFQQNQLQSQQVSQGVNQLLQPINQAVLTRAQFQHADQAQARSQNFQRGLEYDRQDFTIERDALLNQQIVERDRAQEAARWDRFQQIATFEADQRRQLEEETYKRWYTTTEPGYTPEDAARMGLLDQQKARILSDPTMHESDPMSMASVLNDDGVNAMAAIEADLGKIKPIRMERPKTFEELYQPMGDGRFIAVLPDKTGVPRVDVLEPHSATVSAAARKEAADIAAQGQVDKAKAAATATQEKAITDAVNKVYLETLKAKLPMVDAAEAHRQAAQAAQDAAPYIRARFAPQQPQAQMQAPELAEETVQAMALPETLTAEQVDQQSRLLQERTAEGGESPDFQRARELITNTIATYPDVTKIPPQQVGQVQIATEVYIGGLIRQFGAIENMPPEILRSFEQVKKLYKKLEKLPENVSGGKGTSRSKPTGTQASQLQVPIQQSTWQR